MGRYFTQFAAIFILVFSGCHPDSTSTEVPETPKSDLEINFTLTVNSLPLQMDTLRYISANSDTYSVRTVKFFISDLTFYSSTGNNVILGNKFYQDASDTESLKKEISQKIPRRDYEKISFVIGFVNANNISNMFTSNPEYQMFWPENMGGGYHYQKLEGQFLKNGKKNNFNFHAGGLDDIDYSILANFPNTPFTVTDQPIELTINMEIQNWFKTPVIWDFAYFGSAIMQNHEAQETIQKNGHDVFSVTIN